MSHHAPTDSTPNPFENPSPLNMAKTREKVAIVGFVEQNERTAPYDDPEWDIWGFNMANRLGFMHDSQGRFRADRWFDLHEEHAQDAKDMAWINACPVPIYLTHAFGENVWTRKLWLDDVEFMIARRYKRLPVIDYFASSFAYATALALAEGYTTIGFFGVSLDWGRERVVERGNLEYWIGFAQGLGIDIVMSPNSKLLKHPGLYGIEYTKEKEGVEQLCAELVRQLLQSSGIKEKLDQSLVGRANALTHIRQECANLVDRLIYQSVER